MSTPTGAIQGRSLDRTIRVLVIAVIMLAAAFVVFYGVDRYRGNDTKPLDLQLQQLEAKVRDDPGNLTARVALGDVYMSKKEYDRAVALYQTVLDADAKNVNAIAGLGNAYMRKGDNDKAIELLVQFKDMVKTSDFAVADRRLQAVFYQLGRLYLEQGKLDDAAEALKSALAIDRSDADALYLLGNTFSAQGDAEQAVVAYRRATAFVPDFVEAYQGMLQAYQQLGDAKRVAYPRGMIAMLSGDRAQALRDLESYSADVTDDVDVLLGLGWAYEDRGQQAEALGAYQRALSADPQNKVAKSGVQRLGGK